MWHHLAGFDVITDPALSALPTVSDSTALAGHLCECLPELTRGLQELHVRPLRHHAGKRCVVEVSVQTGEQALHLIAKLYARDRSDVYRVMKEIERVGLGPGEEFSIPQPIAYLPAFQLLLQEKVEGRPATDVFLSGAESERAVAAERCARWLARFHAVAPRIGAPFDLSGHLAALERWVRRLASAGESFAAKAAELFARLEAAAVQLPRTDMCTIHGDYTHHQVLFAGDRTVTVDWDNYRLGDPSHDAARFAVGLQRLALRRAGSMRALDGPAGVFLKTYVAASARSGLAARLTFYQAAICLEHGKHDVHKQADGWRERAAAALNEGLRVLERGV